MTEILLSALDWVGYPLMLFTRLDGWIANLIVGVVLSYSMFLGGWVLVRAGRSPLWVFLLLVPHVSLIAIWVFAYTRWPRVDGRERRDPDAA